MQPDLILTPFGEDATPGTIDAIPESRGPSDPPQKATWSTGFPLATMTPLPAGGIPPRGQDVNGVLNAISEHTVFVCGGGQYKWSGEYVAKNGGYAKGDVVQANDGASSYVSLVNSNSTNFNESPESIGTQWAPYSGLAIIPLQATETLAGIAQIATTGQATTGTDDSKIMTPAKVKAAIDGKITLPVPINQGGTGATTATAALNNLGVPTTYAKKDSPALTGTPTAPTAASGTNTTQIATTAFVTELGSEKITGEACDVAGFTEGTLSGDVYFKHKPTQQFVLLAKKDSPALTGTPTAPTASSTTNNAQIATTAFAVSNDIGVGQSLEDVTLLRTSGTTYTNTTPKPIFVIANIDVGVGGNLVLSGKTIQLTDYSGVALQWHSFIVPSGGTYGFNNVGINVGKWLEWR